MQMYMYIHAIQIMMIILIQLGATTFSITRLLFPCSSPQMRKKNSKGQRGGVRDGAGRKRLKDHYAMRSLAKANRVTQKRKRNTQMAHKKVSARVAGAKRMKASRARVAMPMGRKATWHSRLTALRARERAHSNGHDKVLIISRHDECCFNANGSESWHWGMPGG